METSALDGFITTISGGLADFSGSNLGSVVLAGLKLAVPLVLAWFAFRWIYSKVKSAMKKGN